MPCLCPMITYIIEIIGYILIPVTVSDLYEPDLTIVGLSPKPNMEFVVIE